MSIESAVKAGRAAAEASFLDTFTAYSPNGTTTDADGMQVPAWTSSGTTLGKIPNRRTTGDASNARTVSVGGVTRTVIEGGLHLAWAATPQVGQEYVLTTAGPTTHASMVGNRYHVVETHPTSAMTAWRLDVVEVA